MTEEQERPKYTPETYEEFDCGEYRKRFPDETNSLTDEQLFNVVVEQDDDREDDEWRAIFKAGPLSVE